MMKGDLFMNLLGFNPYAFIETLPYMGKGMLGIFIVIGIIVFILRKKIPGLVDYEKEDEEKIAQDNLSRILVDVEPEKKEDKDKEDNAENK